MGLNEDKLKFSNKLRVLLDENDVKQKDLAAFLQIAPSTMSGYIQGTSEPDFKTLKRLADYFNVSIDYLLDHKIGNAQTDREQELLHIFRSLSKEQQILYIEQGKAIIRVNAKGSAKLSKSANGSAKVG